MVLLLFILLRINIIIQIMFIIFIDIDYHLLYNAVVNRDNNYYQNQKRAERSIYNIRPRSPKQPDYPEPTYRHDTGRAFDTGNEFTHI